MFITTTSTLFPSFGPLPPSAFQHRAGHTWKEVAAPSGVSEFAEVMLRKVVSRPSKCTGGVTIRGHTVRASADNAPFPPAQLAWHARHSDSADQSVAFSVTACTTASR